MNLVKAGIREFKSLHPAHLSKTHTVYKGLIVSIPSHQNFIKEYKMLFLTCQIQLTCSSMLQATLMSIHGTLTTPQAKV